MRYCENVQLLEAFCNSFVGIFHGFSIKINAFSSRKFYAEKLNTNFLFKQLIFSFSWKAFPPKRSLAPNVQQTRAVHMKRGSCFALATSPEGEIPCWLSYELARSKHIDRVNTVNTKAASHMRSVTSLKIILIASTNPLSTKIDICLKIVFVYGYFYLESTSVTRRTYNRTSNNLAMNYSCVYLLPGFLKSSLFY